MQIQAKEKLQRKKVLQVVEAGGWIAHNFHLGHQRLCPVRPNNSGLYQNPTIQLLYTLKGLDPVHLD